MSLPLAPRPLGSPHGQHRMEVHTRALRRIVVASGELQAVFLVPKGGQAHGAALENPVVVDDLHDRGPPGHEQLAPALEGLSHQLLAVQVHEGIADAVHEAVAPGQPLGQSRHVHDLKVHGKPRGLAPGALDHGRIEIHPGDRVSPASQGHGMSAGPAGGVQAGAAGAHPAGQEIHRPGFDRKDQVVVRTDRFVELHWINLIPPRTSAPRGRTRRRLPPRRPRGSTR